MHDELHLDMFIVFKIADYLLALPISNVLKVVNFSAANSKRLTTIGLVQLGKYMIKVLDLHQQLDLGGLPHECDNPSFIVVAHDSQGELYGISVNEPPDIVELPPETIRSLPKSSSHGKPIIEMVSHVAVLSQEDVTKTIFLLDLKRIAEPV
ncbi:chemotaxis protein CheW [Mastigocladopsis repens]|uniref:chemotaxis protein CheW n=1 Tax=Mastigocladopsis repens TaxID=221287 RepID=UPI00037E3389|nr:chemotaxis protein CheW [Mastigocladopsis repens]